jgi:hypothetical protein
VYFEGYGRSPDVGDVPHLRSLRERCCSKADLSMAGREVEKRVVSERTRPPYTRPKVDNASQQ